MPDFLIELAGLIERAGGDTNDGTVLSSTGGPADEQDVSQHSMVSGDKPVVEHVQDGTATVDSSSSVDPVDLESNEQVVGPRRSGRTTSKVKKSYCDAPDDDDLDDALGVSVRRVASQSRSLGGTLEHPGQGSLSKPSRLAVDSNNTEYGVTAISSLHLMDATSHIGPVFYTLFPELHDVDELFGHDPNWVPNLTMEPKGLFNKAHGPFPRRSAP
ncbi:hypothetical protein MPER_04354 [Moniliophthora perniciosa FA553]|nr:hypothetical protein MPER_04354 [Moniliophthora perniciosa FA553]